MYHKPLLESTIQIHSGRGKIETTVTLDLIGIIPSKTNGRYFHLKKNGLKFDLCHFFYLLGSAYIIKTFTFARKY